MKIRATTIVAAAAALVCACASAKRNPVLDRYPPGVSGHTSVFYYDVHGSTVAELRADMRRLGPKIDGASFVGETRAPMRWTWRTEATSGACTIREVTVYINAQVTLPRWTPPPNADSSVVAEWNRFLTALEVHEAGHKDISAKSGKAIVDRVRGLSGPCALLNARVNDIARDIVTRAGEEQRAYDATTRHGLTQGTAFGLGRYTANATDALTSMVGPRVGTVRAVLPATVERAWATLPAAFASNGLTIDAVDSVTRVVGDSMIARGKVGTAATADVVDCGVPPTGRNADSVAVAVFVTSRLEQTDSLGTVVTTTMQAVARPSGAAPIPCQSRGILERRLLEALRRALAGS